MTLQDYLDTLDNYSGLENISAMNSRFPPDADYDEPPSASKLAFWTTVLKDCTRMGYLNESRLCLNTLQLSVKFSRNGLTPSCLDQVLVR